MASPPMSDGSVAVVIPAAGSGNRFQAGTDSEPRNKLFAFLSGKPLWTHCVDRLRRRSEVGQILIGVSEPDEPIFQEQADQWLEPVPSKSGSIPLCWFRGGAQRSDTVSAALQLIRDDHAWVAIHDAARPLVSETDLDHVFRKAGETGAAILATPVTGTLKRANLDRSDCETVDRSNMWIAQTPQVIRADWFRSAIQRHRGRPYTDDAQILERMGYPIAIAAGSADNLKLTYHADLAIAEAILRTRSDLNPPPSA